MTAGKIFSPVPMANLAGPFLNRINTSGFPRVPSGNIIIQRLLTFINPFESFNVSSKLISLPSLDLRPIGIRFITGFMIFLLKELSNQ